MSREVELFTNCKAMLESLQLTIEPFIKAETPRHLMSTFKGMNACICHREKTMIFEPEAAKGYTKKVPQELEILVVCRECCCWCFSSSFSPFFAGPILRRPFHHLVKKSWHGMHYHYKHSNFSRFKICILGRCHLIIFPHKLEWVRKCQKQRNLNF